MSALYPARFIYTHFFTASHIILTDNEPGIVLPGVYANMVTGQAEDVTLHCSFGQLNEIVHCDGNDPDEVTTQLADVITAGVSMPVTLDVTEVGGLQCDCLLYCMENLSAGGAEQAQQPAFPEYSLVAFIHKTPLPAFITMGLPVEKQRQESYYLFLLTLQYDFYLHFIKERVPYERALLYSGLHDPLIFQLAKTGHSLRQENVV